MATVAEVSRAMQRVLTTTADEAARASGFVRRASKMTGAKWVQTLVFGWMARPDAKLSDLCDVAAAAGVRITPQGIDGRFGEASAACMRGVLEAAVGALVEASAVRIPLLERFRGGVWLQDAFVVALPDALSDAWPGCGGNRGHTASALKGVVRLDLCGGRLVGPYLMAGKQPEKGSPVRAEPVPEGGLKVADLGFWDVAEMAKVDRSGAWVLSRLRAGSAVYGEGGDRLDVAKLLGKEGGREGGCVDRWVLVGAEQRLRMRLLAVRVPPQVVGQRRRRIRREAQRKGRTPSAERLALAGYNILLTNAPRELLPPDGAYALARARWRIEMLFKLWKSHGRIDEWRTSDPWRILTELYAKLTAMLVQHWLFLVGCWGAPNRSLFKAAQAVAKFAPLLASARGRPGRLREAIRTIADALGSGGCRMGSRRKTPYTYQLLFDPALQGALA